jgi:DNA-binding LacI/PurR family transcriptional regulator
MARSITSSRSDNTPDKAGSRNSSRTRLIDVAKMASVARSTAAQALYGSGGSNVRVSDETAERVRKIARELDFRPNRLARGLRGAMTQSVGAVWSVLEPQTTDASLVNAILTQLQSAGYATYQSNHPVKLDQTCKLLDDLLSRQLDSLVIRLRPDHYESPAVLDLLGQFRSAIAVVPWEVPGLAIDQVIHDRDPGLIQVVDHFVQTGRRKIMMVLSMRDLTEQRKYQVFAQRLAFHGLDPDVHLTVLDRGLESHEMACIYGHFEKLADDALRADCDADAVFSSNDVILMIVARRLRRLGIAVPDQIALAGLNDTLASKYWDPPLAMINRQQDLLVQAVCNLVNARLADPNRPVDKCFVPMQFVVRDSAGGLR